MNGDTRREFVDANILVYAFDLSSGAKHAIAQQLIRTALGFWRWMSQRPNLAGVLRHRDAQAT